MEIYTTLLTQPEVTKFRKQVASALRQGIRRLEKGWTKGAFGRTATGKHVSAWNKEAVRYCAVGSLQAGHKPSKVTKAAQALAEQFIPKKHNTTFDGTPYLTNEGLISFNDQTAKNKYQVIQVFKKALENVETFDVSHYVKD